MQQAATTWICPKGHTSTEADYCSECGARIQGSAVSATAAAGEHAATSEGVCPDCGTVREQKDVVFCEVCGFNFVTGAHGEIPVPPPLAEVESAPAVTSVDAEAEAPAAGLSTAPPAVTRWVACVSVDPVLRRPESPEAPTDVQPYEVSLDQPTSLIGRRNETRGIFPEVPVPHDEAVSRRHALLQLDPSRGLLLRDIGAANGTRLNGQEVQPMIDYPLHDGDEITLGHWTRIKIQGK